ncbi:hypothetical protein [Rathayibacter sp. Leaf248]|uniref:hypothetical protein n=1 Tax=Rathayibacter sp. Leaf248 TaxID=2876555 RepID=UPI001E61DECC|nr:hypothetical protein [Rathayibacter sp. Leaf248]
MSETLILGLFSTVFTAICVLLKGVLDEKARAKERSEQLADRQAERKVAEDTAAEEVRQRAEERRETNNELEKLRTVARAERERAEVYADGKAVANDLLRALTDLQSAWRPDTSRSGTYDYEPEISARIRNYGLLVPNADVRETVEQAMDVIDHVWVADQLGELEAKKEQRRVLKALMREVAAFIRRDSQDPTLLADLKTTNKLIAETVTELDEPS